MGFISYADSKIQNCLVKRGKKLIGVTR